MLQNDCVAEFRKKGYVESGHKTSYFKFPEEQNV